MVIGQIGEIGARVIVITVLEQEHGTELDLAPTQHHIVMEGKINDNMTSIKMEHQKIAYLTKRLSNENLIILVTFTP